MHHLPPFFSRFCLSLMHMSTGERQEWMETLQTATRPPACGSQKRSGTLPHASSTNKRGLLELRGYKGRVLVSLAGSKVRLCKTEQVLPTPSGLPLYRMTASCFVFFLKKGKMRAYLKQWWQMWKCSWMCNVQKVNIFVWNCFRVHWDALGSLERLLIVTLTQSSITATTGWRRNDTRQRM